MPIPKIGVELLSRRGIMLAMDDDLAITRGLVGAWMGESAQTDDLRGDNCLCFCVCACDKQ